MGPHLNDGRAGHDKLDNILCTADPTHSHHRDCHGMTDLMYHSQSDRLDSRTGQTGI
ncbi:hypothetical protein D3C81_735690 [compost metagenome]